MVSRRDEAQIFVCLKPTVEIDTGRLEYVFSAMVYGGIWLD